MEWFAQIEATQPVAYAVLVLFSISVLGLCFGQLKIRKIGLGVTGVLFAGILFGHFGVKIEHSILDFVREFGLILFVYTIGMQLGPSFFASFKKEGLRMNLMAASIVIGGGAIAVAAAWLLKVDFFAVPGLFSGSTTNTPSLGAAQQMLMSVAPTETRASLIALGYAVTYPIGVAGIIASLVIFRGIFRVDVKLERERFQAEQRAGYEPLERRNLVVETTHLDGLTVAELPGVTEFGVRISRIQPAGETAVQNARETSVLHRGDTLLAVGTRPNLDRFQRLVGRVADVNLMKAPGGIGYEKLIVTRRSVLGKSLRELGLDQLHNVTVTRIMRGDVEMTAVPELRLQFGDRLNVVGVREDLLECARSVGNSVKALNETQFIPMFLGIALGVLVGSIPIPLPGIPVPLRLGIAGGPLIVAIILSRIGRWGPLLWHIPLNANLALRELGITLFLACVGLKAGATFFAAAFSANGAAWMTVGILICMVPLLIVGFIGRVFFKFNYLSLCGIIAGSMTDPPALAFANTMAKSDGPAVAYATVYPLTMLLRIVVAQVLVILLLT